MIEPPGFVTARLLTVVCVGLLALCCGVGCRDWDAATHAGAKPAELATPASKAPSFEELTLDVRALTDRLRFEEAMELTERLERESTTPDHGPRFLVLRGFIEVRRGNFDAGARLVAEGEAELKRRGVTGLPLAEAISVRAGISWAKHDLEDALAMWTRAREMVTGESVHERRFRGRMAYNQSQVLSDLGRHEDAIAAATTALEEEEAAGAPACPDLAATRAQLGYFFMRLERYDEAVERYRKGIDSCVGVAGAELISASLRLGLAQTRSFAGAHDEALAQVRKVRTELDANPDATERRFGAAFTEAGILHRAGRFDEEAALISEVTPRFREQHGAAHPNMVRLCLQHVMALVEAGRNAEAAKVIEPCRQEAAALPNGPDETAIKLLDEEAVRIGVARTGTG